MLLFCIFEAFMSTCVLVFYLFVWFKHIYFISIVKQVLALITLESAAWNQPVLVSYEESWL